MNYFFQKGIKLHPVSQKTEKEKSVSNSGDLITPQYVAGVKLLLVKQAPCFQLATVQTKRGDMTCAVRCTDREILLWIDGARV